MAYLKIRNEFLKTKLNFESPPFVRDSTGEDAGTDGWSRDDAKTKCLFVHPFVRSLVRWTVLHETK